MSKHDRVSQFLSEFVIVVRHGRPLPFDDTLNRGKLRAVIDRKDGPVLICSLFDSEVFSVCYHTGFCLCVQTSPGKSALYSVT